MLYFYPLSRLKRATTMNLEIVELLKIIALKKDVAQGLRDLENRRVNKFNIEEIKSRGRKQLSALNQQ